MTIEQNMNSIATSLETIAKCLVDFTNMAQEVKATAETTESPVAPAPPVKEAKKDNEREDLITALDELGVEYNKKAATATLKKKLAAAKTETVKPAKEEKKPKEEEITVEQLREVVKTYAAKNGKLAALALLKKFDATKVSEIKDKEGFINEAAAVSEDADFMG